VTGRARLILLVATGAVLAGCLAAAVLLAVQLVSGVGIDAELSRIREQGAPAASVELTAPPFPKSMNAASVYAEAVAEMHRCGIYSSTDTFRAFCCKRNRDADPRLSSQVRAALPRCGRVISLAQRASRMPLCRFPIEWKKGASATMPHYEHVKQLAAIVMAKAIVEAREGRGDEALRLVGTAFAMSQSLKDEPAIMAQSARLTLVRQASHALRECLAHGGFGAAQARCLLATVSRIDLTDSVRIAMCGERTFGIGVFEDLRENPEGLGLGPPGITACEILQRTLTNADEMCYLRRMAEQVKAARLPYRKIRGAGTAHEMPCPEYAVVSLALVPSVECAALWRDQAIAELAGSQAALALELYRLRFGRYPVTLADLRAKLACRLPKDPFSGKALVYRQRGRGYVLYSIGPDLTDDGGDPPRPSPDSCRGDILWKKT